MVERIKSEQFDQFVGQVSVVKVETGKFGKQYHIEMKPIDVQITGKTGNMHEWVGIPATATDTTIPEGSALDKYLQMVEMVYKEAKSLKGHAEVMSMITGRKFLFKKMRLGKAFEGKEAKEYWVPFREA